MKILIVRTIAIEEDCSVSTYNNQGIGLATELAKLGHECGLVYYAKKGKGFTEEIEREGIKLKVYHIEGKNIVWNAIFNKKLYEICNEYDIIQTSECDQICSWQLYKKYPNKTIIYHGPYKSKYTKKYNLRSKVFDILFSNRHNFKKVHIITKSYLAEDYLRNKGFKNIKTLGVGLNEHNLENQNDEIPKKIKEIIENKKDSKYLLYIGAISKRKNPKFLIEIMNEFVNVQKKTNYKLIIIGNKAYKEEQYYRELFKKIEKYKLSQNIIYIKTIEQRYLEKIYKSSDVFLLPTQYDIFGMVYLEAMYYGVPIITTMCGGSSLLIRENLNGYIRKIDDRQEWIDKIEKICENKKLQEKISINSQNKIRKEYLWKKLAVKFLEEYKKI